MNLKDTIYQHPVVIVSILAITCFVSGIKAYIFIIETARLETLSKSEADEFRKAKAELDKLKADNAGKERPNNKIVPSSVEDTRPHSTPLLKATPNQISKSSIKSTKNPIKNSRNRLSESFVVTIIVPSDMANANVYVDGKPVTAERTHTTIKISIKKKNKSSFIRLAGERECAIEKLIDADQRIPLECR
jgi:hypothetical protein